jgi:hypothetical protein
MISRRRVCSEKEETKTRDDSAAKSATRIKHPASIQPTLCHSEPGAKPGEESAVRRCYDESSRKYRERRLHRYVTLTSSNASQY